MKISNELKTGVTVLVAVLILFVVLFKTGDLSFAKKSYMVKTRFDYVAGVKKLAPVRLSGVEVGEVQSLNILYDKERTYIEARLTIDRNVKLRKDSLATVAILGMMGEKYIEIQSGTSPDFITAGEMIGSQNPMGIDELMETYQEVGENIQDTLGDIRLLVDNFNGTLDENKPKLSRIMDNIEETSEYFVEFAEDIKHHPWKVLSKGKEKTPEELAQSRAERRARKLKEKQAEEAALLQIEDDEVDEVKEVVAQEPLKKKKKSKAKKGKFSSRRR